jgi:hypothetical protein
MSETEKINDTQGEEVSIPCTKCLGKTFHQIELSIDKTLGEWTEGGYFSWISHYQIVRCKGCKTISFRVISYDPDAGKEIGNKWQCTIYEELYPFRIENKIGIIDEELFLLPRNVQRIYKETLQALNGKSPILTGIGLRALVEIICKDKNASGKDLCQKINDLTIQKILTPASADILHKIRTLGNDAAHEVKPHNEKQLALAMDIVEHLIKDVYILPKKVKSHFDNK